MREWFQNCSTSLGGHGRPCDIVAAFLIIVLWAFTGPIFDFKRHLAIIINTGTTIVTFLMVILLQNTQNRDSKAMQLKLDELIRASRSARDEFMRLGESDGSGP